MQIVPNIIRFDTYKILTLVGLIAITVMQALWMNYSYRIVKDELQKKASDALAMAMLVEAGKRQESIDKNASFVINDTGDNNIYTTATGFYEILEKTYHSQFSMKSLAACFQQQLGQNTIGDKFTIFCVNTQNHHVLKRSNDKRYLFSFKTDSVYTKHDKTQALYAEIHSPFAFIFARLGILLLSSLLTAAFIGFSLLKQIQIINKQRKIAQIRQDFSYAMIHDMKQPLATLMMGIGNLQSGKLNGKPTIVQNYLTIMGKETNRLLTLVNKVLTISKIEEKKLTLNKTTVALQPIVDDIKQAFTVNTTKKVIFKSCLQTPTVFADADYLKETLNNLVDNAVKYSSDSVEIEISSVLHSGETLIRVRDNGMGISEHDQRIIFDKFERASALGRTFKGGTGGFGLGLNYVLKVMEAHGGRVTVESELGKYSEFTLFIPVEDERNYQTVIG